MMLYDIKGVNKSVTLNIIIKYQFSVELFAFLFYNAVITH